jgi:CheY-like chemotaxis protein
MPKILFIEGDSTLANIYQKPFLSAGFEFDIVSSGKEALQKISESEFDVVLLEIELPEENGLNILKELRSNPAYSDDLKVIIFSNSSDRNLHKQAIDFGVNGFIVKLDYAPMRLVGEVSRFLHQFSEQRKNAKLFQNGGVPESKNKKILLVEDEDVFVDMFGKRLRDEGYALDIARNGNEGFAKASANAYDLIITDMVMAGMNGKELIDRLKEDDKTKNTPIFLFSASVSEDTLNDIRCDGIRCFMKTHITPSELVREVNTFLG